jgi:hypothetical protein
MSTEIEFIQKEKSLAQRAREAEREWRGKANNPFDRTLGFGKFPFRPIGTLPTKYLKQLIHKELVTDSDDVNTIQAVLTNRTIKAHKHKSHKPKTHT